MTNALEINELKKVYATGVEALKGINLTVEEGDFYALLGPNGAGNRQLSELSPRSSTKHRAMSKSSAMT